MEQNHTLLRLSVMGSCDEGTDFALTTLITIDLSNPIYDHEEYERVTNPQRRVFLKGAMTCGMITVAAASGLLRPARVLAAQWPIGAFEAKNISDALTTLYGTDKVNISKAIKIKAPIQAENGAKVPITVTSALPNTDTIDILIKENVMPLAGRARVANAKGFFSTRIKMAKSSDVQVVVRAGGTLHTASMKIKVTVGGCGG
jgi:sulfur-oxidizing protein SoxY